MKKLEDLVSSFSYPCETNQRCLMAISLCRIEDIEGNFIHGSKSGKKVSKEIIEDMNLVVFQNTVIVSCSANGNLRETTTPL